MTEAGLRAVGPGSTRCTKPRYGHVAKDEVVEVVYVRLVATGRRDTRILTPACRQRDGASLPGPGR